MDGPPPPARAKTKGSGETPFPAPPHPGRPTKGSGASFPDEPAIPSAARGHASRSSSLLGDELVAEFQRERQRLSAEVHALTAENKRLDQRAQEVERRLADAVARAEASDHRRRQVATALDKTHRELAEALARGAGELEQAHERVNELEVRLRDAKDAAQTAEVGRSHASTLADEALAQRNELRQRVEALDEEAARARAEVDQRDRMLRGLVRVVTRREDWLLQYRALHALAAAGRAGRLRKDEETADTAAALFLRRHHLQARALRHLRSWRWRCAARARAARAAEARSMRTLHRVLLSWRGAAASQRQARIAASQGDLRRLAVLAFARFVRGRLDGNCKRALHRWRRNADVEAWLTARGDAVGAAEEAAILRTTLGKTQDALAVCKRKLRAGHGIVIARTLTVLANSRQRAAFAAWRRGARKQVAFLAALRMGHNVRSEAAADAVAHWRAKAATARVARRLCERSLLRCRSVALHRWRNRAAASKHAAYMRARIQRALLRRAVQGWHSKVRQLHTSRGAAYSLLRARDRGVMATTWASLRLHTVRASAQRREMGARPQHMARALRRLARGSLQSAFRLWAASSTRAHRLRWTATVLARGEKEARRAAALLCFRALAAHAQTRIRWRRYTMGPVCRALLRRRQSGAIRRWRARTHERRMAAQTAQGRNRARTAAVLAAWHRTAHRACLQRRTLQRIARGARVRTLTAAWDVLQRERVERLAVTRLTAFQRQRLLQRVLQDWEKLVYRRGAARAVVQRAAATGRRGALRSAVQQLRSHNACHRRLARTVCHAVMRYRSATLARAVAQWRAAAAVAAARDGFAATLRRRVLFTIRSRLAAGAMAAWKQHTVARATARSGARRAAAWLAMRTTAGAFAKWRANVSALQQRTGLFERAGGHIRLAKAAQAMRSWEAYVERRQNARAVCARLIRSAARRTILGGFETWKWEAREAALASAADTLFAQLYRGRARTALSRLAAAASARRTLRRASRMFHLQESGRRARRGLLEWHSRTAHAKRTRVVLSLVRARLHQKGLAFNFAVWKRMWSTAVVQRGVQKQRQQALRRGWEIATRQRRRAAFRLMQRIAMQRRIVHRLEMRRTTRAMRHGWRMLAEGARIEAEVEAAVTRVSAVRRARRCVHSAFTAWRHIVRLREAARMGAFALGALRGKELARRTVQAWHTAVVMRKARRAAVTIRARSGISSPAAVQSRCFHGWRMVTARRVRFRHALTTQQLNRRVSTTRRVFSAWRAQHFALRIAHGFAQGAQRGSRALALARTFAAWRVHAVGASARRAQEGDSRRLRRAYCGLCAVVAAAHATRSGAATAVRRRRQRRLLDAWRNEWHRRRAVPGCVMTLVAVSERATLRCALDRWWTGAAYCAEEAEAGRAYCLARAFAGWRTLWEATEAAVAARTKVLAAKRESAAAARGLAQWRRAASASSTIRRSQAIFLSHSAGWRKHAAIARWAGHARARATVRATVSALAATSATLRRARALAQWRGHTTRQLQYRSMRATAVRHAGEFLQRRVLRAWRSEGVRFARRDLARAREACGRLQPQLKLRRIVVAWAAAARVSARSGRLMRAALRRYHLLTAGRVLRAWRDLSRRQRAVMDQTQRLARRIAHRQIAAAWRTWRGHCRSADAWKDLMHRSLSRAFGAAQRTALRAFFLRWRVETTARADVAAVARSARSAVQHFGPRAAVLRCLLRAATARIDTARGREKQRGQSAVLEGRAACTLALVLWFQTAREEAVIAQRAVVAARFIARAGLARAFRALRGVVTGERRRRRAAGRLVTSRVTTHITRAHLRAWRAVAVTRGAQRAGAFRMACARGVAERQRAILRWRRHTARSRAARIVSAASHRRIAGRAFEALRSHTMHMQRARRLVTATMAPREGALLMRSLQVWQRWLSARHRRRQAIVRYWVLSRQHAAFSVLVAARNQVVAAVQRHKARLVGRVFAAWAATASHAQAVRAEASARSQAEDAALRSILSSCLRAWAVAVTEWRGFRKAVLRRGDISARRNTLSRCFTALRSHADTARRDSENRAALQIQGRVRMRLARKAVTHTAEKQRLQYAFRGWRAAAALVRDARARALVYWRGRNARAVRRAVQTWYLRMRSHRAMRVMAGRSERQLLRRRFADWRGGVAAGRHVRASVQRALHSVQRRTLAHRLGRWRRVCREMACIQRLRSLCLGAHLRAWAEAAQRASRVRAYAVEAAQQIALGRARRALQWMARHAARRRQQRKHDILVAHAMHRVMRRRAVIAWKDAAHRRRAAARARRRASAWRDRRLARRVLLALRYARTEGAQQDRTAAQHAQRWRSKATAAAFSAWRNAARDSVVVRARQQHVLRVCTAWRQRRWKHRVLHALRRYARARKVMRRVIRRGAQRLGRSALQTAFSRLWQHRRHAGGTEGIVQGMFATWRRGALSRAWRRWTQESHADAVLRAVAAVWTQRMRRSALRAWRREAAAKSQRAAAAERILLRLLGASKLTYLRRWRIHTQLRTAHAAADALAGRHSARRWQWRAFHALARAAALARSRRALVARLAQHSARRTQWVVLVAWQKEVNAQRGRRMHVLRAVSALQLYTWSGARASARDATARALLRWRLQARDASAEERLAAAVARALGQMAIIRRRASVARVLSAWRELALRKRSAAWACTSARWHTQARRWRVNACLLRWRSAALSRTAQAATARAGQTRSRCMIVLDELQHVTRRAREAEERAAAYSQTKNLLKHELERTSERARELASEMARRTEVARKRPTATLADLRGRDARIELLERENMLLRARFTLASAGTALPTPPDVEPVSVGHIEGEYSGRVRDTGPPPSPEDKEVTGLAREDVEWPRVSGRGNGARDAPVVSGDQGWAGLSTSGRSDRSDASSGGELTVSELLERGMGGSQSRRRRRPRRESLGDDSADTAERALAVVGPTPATPSPTAAQRGGLAVPPPSASSTQHAAYHALSPTWRTTPATRIHGEVPSWSRLTDTD